MFSGGVEVAASLLEVVASPVTLLWLVDDAVSVRTIDGASMTVLVLVGRFNQFERN